MCSTNVIYNHNAFSHYDTILLAHKLHRKEFKNYNFFNNNPKLINFGYPKIDKLCKESNKNKINTDNKKILIAPTWGDESAAFRVYEKIIEILLIKSFQVTFRPHPVSILNSKNLINDINKKFFKFSSFKISYAEDNLEDYISNHLIISDWSGSAIEYSLGTKKPCIFINTKRKVRNKNFSLKEIENSFENVFRKEVGKTFEIKEIENIPDFIVNKEYLNLFEKKVDYFRDQYLYNFKNTKNEVWKFIKSIS